MELWSNEKYLCTMTADRLFKTSIYCQHYTHYSMKLGTDIYFVMLTTYVQTGNKHIKLCFAAQNKDKTMF